jgi:hypothetical protein
VIGLIDTARAFATAVALAAGFAAPVAAGICDWRPSAMIGGGGTAAVAGGAGAVGAAGAGMKVAGFYTLVHSTSGLTMLGSAAAGASGAGTVGIIGGTAGVAGTAGAILMAPATIIAAIGTAVAVVGLEGACWLGDDRITEPAEVAVYLRSMNAVADPAFFRFREGNALANTDLLVRDKAGRMQRYLLSDLYIVNGVLKHRDWGLNTTIGRIGFVATATTED